MTSAPLNLPKSPSQTSISLNFSTESLNFSFFTFFRSDVTEAIAKGTGSNVWSPNLMGVV